MWLGHAGLSHLAQQGIKQAMQELANDDGRRYGNVSRQAKSQAFSCDVTAECRKSGKEYKGIHGLHVHMGHKHPNYNY